MMGSSFRYAHLTIETATAEVTTTAGMEGLGRGQVAEPEVGWKMEHGPTEFGSSLLQPLKM